jgi:hypothetical protein
MRRFCVAGLIATSVLAGSGVEASAGSRGSGAPSLPPSCVIAQKLLGAAYAKAGLTLRNWVTMYVIERSGRSASSQFTTFSCAQLLLLPHPPKPKVDSPFSSIPSRIPPDVSLVLAWKFARAQMTQVGAQCLPLIPVASSSSSIAAALATSTGVARVGICKGNFQQPVIVGTKRAHGGVVWTASIQPNDEYLLPRLRLPARAAEQVTIAWLTRIRFNGHAPPA